MPVSPRRLLLSLLSLVALALPLDAAELTVLLPLGRTAYRTDESIDVAVVRGAAQALAAGQLEFTLSGADGSRVTATFPAAAVAMQGESARATEHVRLNARLLRPGHYTLSVACDGVTQQAEFDVCSHVRKTTFRLIDWGGSGNGADQVRCGEDGTGINLMYGSYAGHDQSANIRGGMDYMRNCTMAGAHQMDGRLECDWSDPYVVAGGNARVARQALHDRTSPNVLGVHFYDEPGLTWQPHPQTGVFSPHNIPSQDWAFKAAWGRDALQYHEVKPEDPAHYAAWEQWLRWKQVFMEAAWRAADYSVRSVNPGFLTATQSMYGWIAFGDGYYFNIVRPLSVMSGHGGYDDYAGGYLAPGFFFEMGRMRDYDKPVWYLPGWWENIPSEIFRLEQYLTFMMGAQGVAVPPGVRTESPGTLFQDEAVVEANRTMARLGTIFTAMPVTRPEVAMLYSMSQNVKAMVASKDFSNGQDFPGQVERLFQLFVAAKMAHIPVWPVVEEDILDGTVAADHKVLLLTGLEVLDPKVITALEDWIRAGGRVILSDECQVTIAGATRLGVPVTTKIYEAAAKEYGSGEQATRQKRGCSARSALSYYREGAPVAKALASRCREAGVLPAAEISEPQVFVSRHAEGDVEYLFLANATSDPEQVKKLYWNGIKAAEANVAFAGTDRPLYDLLHSREAGEFKADGGKLAARLRFGPGQFRAFARTARPIGGVQIVHAGMEPSFYQRDTHPRSLGVDAVVVDAAGKALAGALPLAVQVVDPLGVKRYDLYRATERGVLRLNLPLGVNEVPGTWTVTVRELLSGKEDSATFACAAPATCGAVAGKAWRALYFAQDYDSIYRFFRTHRTVALIVGSSDFDTAQAQRLAEILKPWGITATIVPAAGIRARDRAKDRPRTWVGAYDNPDFDMPGEAAVLIGSPEDNPVIKTLDQGRFRTLPYVPAKDAFPGRGRGMLAWQKDAVSFNDYETVTLIAYDAEGMAEAVGTVFEIASGYLPPTPQELAGRTQVTPATQAPGLVPELKVAWEAILADRAVTLTVAGDRLEVLTLDGSLTRIGADGKVASRKDGREAEALAAFHEVMKPHPEPTLDAALKDPTKVAKFAATNAGMTAVAFWGGTLKLFDAQGRLVAQRMLPHDIAALAWAGDRVVAALADGRIVALSAR